jgi:hypothetical protein
MINATLIEAAHVLFARLDQIESSAMTSRQESVPAEITIALNTTSLSGRRDQRDFGSITTLRHRIRATARATCTPANLRLRVRIVLPLSHIVAPRQAVGSAICAKNAANHE